MSALLRKYNNRENGFTLIELLIVVLIIGILAAIAIPVYLGLQNQAKNNSAKQDTNSAVTSIQVALTEGQDLATALNANSDSGNRSDGNQVVATPALDGSKNYTVVGTQSSTGFTYTYDSKTGQFTEGSGNINLGGGAPTNTGPYTPTGTTNGDGCNMELPGYCNTQNTGLKANFYGVSFSQPQNSGFVNSAALAHSGNGSWQTISASNGKMGTEVYLAAATVGNTYRWDIYVKGAGSNFTPTVVNGANNVSLTVNTNPDTTGYTLIQLTYTATTTTPRVDIITTNTFVTPTTAYWDDYKVYLP